MKSQFAGEIASAFYPLTDRYVGSWLTLLIEVLIVTGSFACAMSFYNTGARYLFALGREGVLPGALARTSKRRSPAAASMTVTGIVALYCLAFVIYDPSTEGALLKLGTWSPLLGVLGILAVQALVSVAIIRYFLTYREVGLPLVDHAGRAADRLRRDGGACVLLVANRGDLAGAADAALHPDAALGGPRRSSSSGMAVAACLRSSARTAYAGIGQFEPMTARPPRPRPKDRPA